MKNDLDFQGAPEMLETGRVMENASRLVGRGAYDLPPWLFPSVDSRQLFQTGSAVPGVYGTIQTVLEYRVPVGFQAVVTHVMHAYEGTGFVPGSGDILWNIDVDRQASSFLPNGRVVEGFLNIKIPLGSYMIPWPVPAAIRLKALETIRYKATPVATVALGAGTVFNCAIIGHLWPLK